MSDYRSEVSDRYARVADGFGTRLRGVAPDQWSLSSPCSDWSARDVAVHVVNTHRRVRAALGDVSAEEIDGDDPADDLDTEWVAATEAIRAALSDQALASKTVGGMFGEQPFESLVGRLLCADTLLHTWDLARATSQDDRLDEEAAARALEFLTPIDDAIRRPGGFAPKLPPPDGADAQARLLAFAGRAV
jgi:uncharacterized protein (TIGR03086 family)